MSSSSLPTLNWITQDTACVDYRPVVNSTGDSVIFERTPLGSSVSPTLLYVVDNFSSPNPQAAQPFLSGTAPVSQTRPDWQWTTDGPVLFNGAASNSGTVSVWMAAYDGTNAQPISGTTNAYYPRWNVGGQTFVTENSGSAASPNPPWNTVFNLDGSVSAGNANIDGNDPLGQQLYGGMPGVNPKGGMAIAFAGQPVIRGGWLPGYNEDFNYVFLNSVANGVYSSKPMESQASLVSFKPDYQGRAPDWSPDATTIAFESNRAGYGYAIFLCTNGGKPVMVTDPFLNAQHARFFPNGSQLVFTIQLGSNTAARGIAWIDVSSLL